MGKEIATLIHERYRFFIIDKSQPVLAGSRALAVCLYRTDGFTADVLRAVRHRAWPTTYRSFNVTSKSTSAWVIQQLRETFPYDTAPRHLILDRDTIFSPAVVRFASPPERLIVVRGRIPWLNAGSVAAGTSCSNMLLSWGASSCPTDTFLPRVPSRGSLSSWVRQGCTEPQSSQAATFDYSQGRRVASRRWTSTSLREARGRLTLCRVRCPVIG